jgi:hypothetical protein
MTKKKTIDNLDIKGYTILQNICSKGGKFVMNYLVVDGETGNYVHESSVKDTDEGLKLITYTGRASGLRFHSTYEEAEQAKDNILRNIGRFKIHRNLQISSRDVDNMKAGEQIILTLN